MITEPEEESTTGEGDHRNQRTTQAKLLVFQKNEKIKSFGIYYYLVLLLGSSSFSSAVKFLKLEERKEDANFESYFGKFEAFLIFPAKDTPPW